MPKYASKAGNWNTALKTIDEVSTSPYLSFASMEVFSSMSQVILA